MRSITTGERMDTHDDGHPEQNSPETLYARAAVGARHPSAPPTRKLRARGQRRLPNSPTGWRPITFSRRSGLFILHRHIFASSAAIVAGVLTFLAVVVIIGGRMASPRRGGNLIAVDVRDRQLSANLRAPRRLLPRHHHLSFLLLRQHLLGLSA